MENRGLQRNWVRILLTVLTLAVMVMIFLFSRETAQKSDATSGTLTRWVISIVWPDFGDYPEEEQQAVKYAEYLDVIFGDAYEVIPALVLTGAADLYSWENLPGTTAEVPVCSGDMLFNLFDEFIGFLC